jgi:hypothetical protein
VSCTRVSVVIILLVCVRVYAMCKVFYNERMCVHVCAYCVCVCMFSLCGMHSTCLCVAHVHMFLVILICVCVCRLIIGN